MFDYGCFEKDVRKFDRKIKLVEMKEIEKSFGGVVALSGVNFNIFAGEVHALVGENGAGKSTLIKILSGLHTADQGSITIMEKPVIIRNPIQAIGFGIYTIYQETNLVPDLSVAENIFIGRYQRHNKIHFLIDSARQHQLAFDILKRFDFNIDTRKKVRDLGVAECQIVAIAKSLIYKCKILILDEPTANITQVETDDLFSILKNLKDQGVGIIYISHRLEELEQIADRVTVLRDGKLLKTWNIAKADVDEIISLMIGRRLDQKFPELISSGGKELIRIDKLSNPPVFTDISFILNEGEIMGIAGLPDSGKVELVQALYGLYPYRSGSIFIQGRKKKFDRSKQASKAGIGFVPGDRMKEGIIPTFSVKHNITISILNRLIRFFGVLWLKRENQIANDYKKRLKIRLNSLDQNVLSLSGGNQQKVVVAKALCAKPKIYIFVEPTRGIDVGTKYEIYVLLAQLAKEGHGIVLVSSELPELLAMCHRIIVFHKGKLKSQFTRDEANQDKILSASFGRSENCGMQDNKLIK